MSVNGNLVNVPNLVRFLDYEARRHVNTNSDSELLWVYPSFSLQFRVFANLDSPGSTFSPMPSANLAKPEQT